MTANFGFRGMICGLVLLTCTMMAAPGHGQQSSPKPEESRDATAGAISIEGEAAWVLNLPGAQAAVITPNGSAFSPVKKTHIAPSAGVTFWVTRWLGAYGEFVAIDGGKAYAQVGSLSSNVTDSLYGAYFGAQFQYPRGLVRPYVELGGGALHESLTGSLVGEAFQGSATVGSSRAGGGVRILDRPGSHWGGKLAVELYEFKSNGTTRTYPRVAFGWFWQSRGKQR